MKNGIALLTAVSVLLCLTSCKDDPPPKSKVGFELTEAEVKESDGTTSSFHPLLLTGATGHDITIAIKLDRAVAENSVISLTVAGTASSQTTATSVPDYIFVSDSHNLILEKGQSTGEIKLTIYEDTDFEYDSNAKSLVETVVITLNSVVSGTAIIDEESKEFTLSIVEDDAVVFLDWDSGDGTRGDVDMDTFLFLDGSTITGASSQGNALEAFNISPSYPNGSYGMSYTYYSGTSDALKFHSIMFNFGGTLNGGKYDSFDGNPLQFEGNYTKKNINPYDAANGTDPVVVQTMTKNGFNYSSISQINEPVSGSRMSAIGGQGSKSLISKLSHEKIELILSSLKN